MHSCRKARRLLHENPDLDDGADANGLAPLLAVIRQTVKIGIVTARLITVFPLLFLVTVFWKPALFEHKTILHGDSILHGLALLTLQATSFRHLGQILWASGVYGGHPLFAEGQGAFASPFSMLQAWIIAPLAGPIFAMNLGHWLSMVLIGVGMIGLCRNLGLSRAASCFAAIAVVLSTIWIGMQQNISIAGTLTWVPWALWAMEAWLKKPGPRSAILLGAAVAMMILSGYPQAFHGAMIYMVAALVPSLFDKAERRRWLSDRRVLVGTAGFAILVAVGLSAVQWLPLMELTGLSHRSQGITIAYHFPLSVYLRGLLFTMPLHQDIAPYFPITGSLLVSAAASLAVIFLPSGRILGHLLAAIMLLQLGVEEKSPVFRLIYDHDLIPGLRYFRATHLYINVAIIALGVLAAFTIDSLSRWSIKRAGASPAAAREWIRITAGLAIIAFWAWLSWKLQLPGVRWTNYAIAAAAALGSAILIVSRRGSFIPVLILALLVGECMNLRLHEFRFYDPQLLAEPEPAAILTSPSYRDSKLFDATITAAYSFTDSRDPDEVAKFDRMMESISAMSNLLWGLQSMNGALALPMHRQVESEKVMRAEIAGDAASPPGLRLIDLLAVRFISVDQIPTTAAFRLFWHDLALSRQIMENTAALPRFQLYTRHISVASADEALEAIKRLRDPVLVIENPQSDHQTEMPDSVEEQWENGGDAPAAFQVLKVKSTEYRIDVTARRPVWFFVADANYPGWHATVDGAPAPLFSAQVLGKAVGIPAGRHRLEIRFDSLTVLWGLWVSVATLVLAGAFFLLAHRRARSSSEKAIP